MNIAEEMERAIRLERARGDVRQALRNLSQDDQRAVLISALAELTANDPSGADSAHSSLRSSATPSRPERGRRSAAKNLARDRQFPSDEGRSKRLLNALQERPRRPLHELCVAVYGEDTRDAHNKVRSLLAALKKRGKVRSDKPGSWEVVPEGEQVSPNETGDESEDVEDSPV